MTDSQLDPESQARLLAAVNAAPDLGEQPCSRPHGDAPCRDVETDRDQWQQRAERAEAAVARVRAVAAELRHKDAVRILAALDGTQQPGEELRERARAAAVGAWREWLRPGQAQGLLAHAIADAVFDLLVPRPEQPAEPGDTR